MEKNQLPPMPPMQSQSAPPVPQVPVAAIQESHEDKIAEKDLIIEEKDKALSEANSLLEVQDAELKAALAEIEKLKAAPPVPVVAKKEVVGDLGKPKEVVEAFASGKPVSVRATTKGIYPNCIRRKRGDVFKLAKLEDFSASWHELVK
jgi:hypothetical protein